MSAFEPIATKKSIHVLIVEDNPGDRRLLHIYLSEISSANFEIHSAHSIEQVRLLRSHSAFDVILLDLNLPDSSGLGTVAWMRAYFPETPIIVVTEYDGDKQGIGAIGLGAQFYINKSQICPEVLYPAILSVIERQRLERTSQTLANIVEKASELIFLINRDGIITYVNGAAAEATGWLRNEFLERPLSEFESHRNGYFIGEDIGKFLGQSVSWAGELYFKTKKGVELALFATITTLDNTQFAMIARDLSTLRLLEKQLGEQFRVLAIKQLIGSIAHNLNNHLTVIEGHSELALMDCPPAPENGHTLAEDLRTISESTRLAGHLTGMLTSMTSQEIALPVPLHLDNLIHQTQRVFALSVGESVHITYRLNAPEQLILADPIFIQHFLVVLAIDANSYRIDNPRLVIETRRAHVGPDHPAHAKGAEAGDYVELSVGIYEASNPLTAKTEQFVSIGNSPPAGSAMNSAMHAAHLIATRSKWPIFFFQNSRKETSFRILIPAHRKSERSPSPIAAERRVEGHQLTIVLLEDSKTVKKIAARALKNAGFHVIEVSGLNHLTQLLPFQSPPTLLLADIYLPDGDGGEANRLLQRHHPDTPVLFTSGQRDFHRHLNKFEGGDINFLPKPYRPSQLVQRVLEILSPEV
ncbi:MAG: response regulator [Sumerlaeia bacterium]